MVPRIRDLKHISRLSVALLTLEFPAYSYGNYFWNSSCKEACKEVGVIFDEDLFAYCLEEYNECRFMVIRNLPLEYDRPSPSSALQGQLVLPTVIYKTEVPFHPWRVTELTQEQKQQQQRKTTTQKASSHPLSHPVSSHTTTNLTTAATIQQSPQHIVTSDCNSLTIPSHQLQRPHLVKAHHHHESDRTMFLGIHPIEMRRVP
ncbi:hypothetical protein Pelo_11995 [Pelomyxa schiedti]|nr:hypothetical protein Pelo_11995 [Pelomyxa schiedti]